MSTFIDTNPNFFAITYDGWKYSRVGCTCGFWDSVHNEPYRKQGSNGPTSCPKCGTRKKGVFGRTAAKYVETEFKNVGEKQFELKVHVQMYSFSSSKMTKNAVYEVGFNYLDKKYDIKINGRDPRTKDIGGYYERVLNGMYVTELLDVLTKEQNSTFWKIILNTFPHPTTLGKALNVLINKDYSGIEIVATSKFAPLLEKASRHDIRNDFSSSHTLSILESKGTNLRNVLGMTKGEINSMYRVVELMTTHRQTREQWEKNPLCIMRLYRKMLRNLSTQTIEEVFRTAIEEGHIDFVMQHYSAVEPLLTTYNYKNDPARLFRYLLRDLKLEQGIMTPREGARLLFDYARMMTDLERTPERFPTSLKKVHDIASMNYRVVEDHVKKRGFARRSEELQELTHTGRRFSFVLPKEPRDLVQEGTSLHHCVASYVDDVIRSHCAIVFMRSNRELDKPHVTIEVRDNRIVQARGQSNRVCTQEEKDAIRAWSRAKELEYVTR